MPPKEKDKKEKPAGWDLDPIESGLILLLLLAVFGSIGPMAWNYFSSGEVSFYGVKLSSFVQFLKSNIQIFKMLGYLFAGAGAIGAIIFNKKGDVIWRETKARHYLEETLAVSNAEEETLDPVVERWKKVLEHASSENPSDWRIAVIEADIILDDLLSVLNLPGSTIGDKLKAVEPSDFLTLDKAWEAHKARNMIAHQGSNFLINQREIHRIISLYEAVFREFKMI